MLSIIRSYGGETERQKERVSLEQSDNELETYNKLQKGFYKQSPASSKHSRSARINSNLELNILLYTHMQP